MRPTLDLTGLIQSSQALSAQIWYALLKRHQPALDGTGILKLKTVDTSKLTKCVIHEPEAFPQPLIKELALIGDLMASDEHPRLLSRLRYLRNELPLPMSATTGDLAAMIVMESVEAAEQLVLELQPLRCRRTYCYYPLTAGSQAFSLTNKRMKQLETEFDALAGRTCRVRGTKVTQTTTDKGFRIRIDRSDVVHRAMVCQDDTTSRDIIQFMPVQCDLVDYDTHHHQLFVQCRRPSDVRDVARLVGAIVFGSEGTFISDAPQQFLTVKPLREKGEASVACEDVIGLAKASATRIDWFRRHNPDHEQHLYTTAGLEYECNGMMSCIPRDVEITRLDFRFTLTTHRVRNVRLQLPNIIVFLNDDDGDLALTFLRNRSFINARKEAIHGVTYPLLGSA
ncbi:MAG: hypothetical protein ACK5Q4_13565 [Phycisphaerae bacterium]|jgi:hypothetical protein